MKLDPFERAMKEIPIKPFPPRVMVIAWVSMFLFSLTIWGGIAWLIWR